MCAYVLFVSTITMSIYDNEQNKSGSNNSQYHYAPGKLMISFSINRCGVENFSYIYIYIYKKLILKNQPGNYTKYN